MIHKLFFLWLMCSNTLYADDKMGNLRIQIHYSWNECISKTSCEIVASGNVELFSNLPETETLENDPWVSQHSIHLNYSHIDENLNLRLSRYFDESEDFVILQEFKNMSHSLEVSDLHSVPKQMLNRVVDRQHNKSIHLITEIEISPNF